jgi:hypothetical protein
MKDDVGYGSLADISKRIRDVRFVPDVPPYLLPESAHQEREWNIRYG